MEKTLIKNNKDVDEAISFFGESFTDRIIKLTRAKPCFLIANNYNDVRFGTGIDFDVVKLTDFKDKKSGEVIF